MFHVIVTHISSVHTHVRRNVDKLCRVEVMMLLYTTKNNWRPTQKLTVHCKTAGVVIPGKSLSQNLSSCSTAILAALLRTAPTPLWYTSLLMLSNVR